MADGRIPSTLPQNLGWYNQYFWVWVRYLSFFYKHVLDLVVVSISFFLLTRLVALSILFILFCGHHRLLFSFLLFLALHLLLRRCEIAVLKKPEIILNVFSILVISGFFLYMCIYCFCFNYFIRLLSCNCCLVAVLVSLILWRTFCFCLWLFYLLVFGCLGGTFRRVLI